MSADGRSLRQVHPAPPLGAEDVGFDDLSQPHPLAARALRQAINGADTPDLTALGTTDAAAARAFAVHCLNSLCFDHRLKRWRVLEGPRWRVDETGEAERRLQDYLEQCAVAAVSDRDTSKQQRDSLVKLSLKRLDARPLKNLLELAGVQDGIAVRGDEFDLNPWLLCVSNGVVDLQTRQFRAALPSDRLSLGTSVAYDPGASCERWEAFVREVMEGNAAKVKFLQRLVGYIATGSTREQVFTAFHGVTGANGKSVFARVILRVLDEYGLTLPFASFVGDGQQGGSATPDLAAMPGRRLVLASEARPKARFDEARIKALTGQDVISARPLYGRPFEFTPVCKLLFLFNDKPAVTDTSSAFWRRCLLVPFNRRFAENEQDQNLFEKLEEEASGILNWVIQGAHEWLSEGLNPPPEIRNAVTEWRAECDVIAEFLAAGCTRHTGHWTPANQMYSAFIAWCDQEHVEPRERVARRAFTGRLRGLVESARRAEGLGFLHIRPTKVTL